MLFRARRCLHTESKSVTQTKISGFRIHPESGNLDSGAVSKPSTARCVADNCRGLFVMSWRPFNAFDFHSRPGSRPGSRVHGNRRRTNLRTPDDGNGKQLRERFVRFAVGERRLRKWAMRIRNRIRGREHARAGVLGGHGSANDVRPLDAIRRNRLAVRGSAG